MSDTTTDERIGTVEPEEERAARDRPDALRVRGLTKVYDDGTLAVDDVDFAVREGDFCVLIGPSGCGKTTTLQSIVGTVEPTRGEVVLDGVDVTDAPTYDRDIGLVFQDFQLFPHLTVAENVRYGLDRTGVEDAVAREQVDDVLRLMRLDDARDRAPEELSAGQRQRVALARSLVLEPKLLLLDEPLGDLDYKMQKRMERELQRIHRELDTTFVYVTHDQNQAMRLGDQVVVMNDGLIEQSGSVSEVYNRPATAFVAAFVGDSNIFAGDVVSVTEGVAVVRTDVGRFTAAVRDSPSSGDDVAGEAVSFVVRPHALRLDADAENTLACSVTDVIQQPGAGTQLLLEASTDDGRRTELQLRSHERLEDLDASVVVGWATRDATVLPETSVVSDVDLQTDVLGE